MFQEVWVAGTNEELLQNASARMNVCVASAITAHTLELHSKDIKLNKAILRRMSTLWLGEPRALGKKAVSNRSRWYPKEIPRQEE